MARPDHGVAFAHNLLALATTELRRDLNRPDLQTEHGGNVSAWARRLGVDPRDIIDFSSSINPLGPTPAARKAFVKSFGELSRYPDEEGHELRLALAQRHGVVADEVLLGNGSSQLIRLVCRAFRPQKALVVAPAFSEYDNALKILGTDVQPYVLSPQESFRLPIEEFIQQWDQGLEMILLANPNSVTGRVVSKNEMAKISRVARDKRIVLVVDEAFMDFTEHDSAKRLVQKNPHLVVLRSLTKYYALPGLRVGYLLAERGIVNLLRLHQEPWSVNTPAQHVSLACLKDRTFESKTSRWLEREKHYLINSLSRLKGLHPYPTHANFILVRLEGEKPNALDLRRFLLQRKLLIRSCDNFWGLGHNYFRVAVKGRRENTQLIKGLREFLP